MRNKILDYDQVEEIQNKFAEETNFIEKKDLGKTKYGLPIRHFIAGIGKNDIVITRSDSW